MDSIREIYRIGIGPSSSHSMGPRRAAERFAGENAGASSFRVTLYGSLAATGRGHFTDKAIGDALSPRHAEIIWREDVILPRHPNGMVFESLDEKGSVLKTWRVYSVGGGALRDEETFDCPHVTVYPHASMTAILDHVVKSGITFWEYVEIYESKQIWEYLGSVWNGMKNAIERGLAGEGVLPGKLSLQRKASSYYVKAHTATGYIRQINLLFAYALACSEENASGGTVVTAPTCGSCGVLPSVLYLLHREYEFPEPRILHALATAGVIGNLAKTNASISGAEVGCQGEVGVACAMAAGASSYLLGESPHQIEYAAEMALEHHLGLTCDPIEGFVQIPCIERNAMAAARAMNCTIFSMFSDGRHKISYDDVLKTMLQTGRDLKDGYRETSRGGLANNVKVAETGSEGARL